MIPQVDTRPQLKDKCGLQRMDQHICGETLSVSGDSRRT